MSNKKSKAGLPPGSVIYTGDVKLKQVKIHFLSYDESSLKESSWSSDQFVLLPLSEETIVDWYDVRGMQDTPLIEKIAQTFDVHPLVKENAVDVHQRPTFQEYDKGIFLIIKSLSFDNETKKVNIEHLAIYFRKGLLLTFQETESDLFASVRKRIVSANGKIRQRGADYLAYAIFDTIIDNYYTVLDAVEDELESIEEKIFNYPENEDRGKLHLIKKEIVTIRKSVAPLRETISRFSKTENNLVEERTQQFVRNLYENTVQVMDTIESYRDMTNSLQDVFISEVSFKMNKVMQLLTLISVIFIPLTFLAGIYGMNFENIPELKLKYGYFILLTLMVVIAVSLFLFFKRKKWF